MHRVVYAGDDSYSPCLHALLNRDDVSVVGCLTAQDQRFTVEILGLCNDHDIPVWPVAPDRSTWAEVNALDADLLVVAAYGHRVPVADLTSIRAKLNVHPSLLPAGRGPNPLPVIASDRPEAAGVTIHLIEETFDSGPIVVQQRIEGLGPRPSLTDLTLAAMALGPRLLDRLLDDLDGHLERAVPQNGGDYWPHIDPDRAQVDLKSATGPEIVECARTFAHQGLSLVLADGVTIDAATVHFTPVEHGFRPGEIVGRLRGDYLVSAVDGMVRAFLFHDGATPVAATEAN